MSRFLHVLDRFRRPRYDRPPLANAGVGGCRTVACGRPPRCSPRGSWGAASRAISSNRRTRTSTPRSGTACKSTCRRCWTGWPTRVCGSGPERSCPWPPAASALATALGRFPRACRSWSAVGSEDRRAPLSEAQEVLDQVPSGGKLVVFEGAAHVPLDRYDPPLYERTVLELLSRAPQRASSPPRPYTPPSSRDLDLR